MIVLAVARHGQAGQQGSLGDAVAEFLFDLEGALDIALSVLGLVAAQRDDGEIVEDDGEALIFVRAGVDRLRLFEISARFVARAETAIDRADVVEGRRLLIAVGQLDEQRSGLREDVERGLGIAHVALHPGEVISVDRLAPGVVRLLAQRDRGVELGDGVGLVALRVVGHSEIGGGGRFDVAIAGATGGAPSLKVGLDGLIDVAEAEQCAGDVAQGGGFLLRIVGGSGGVETFVERGEGGVLVAHCGQRQAEIVAVLVGGGRVVEL